MGTLYRVDSSIHADHSITREMADDLERAWSAELPDGSVVRRDLVRTPLSPAVWTAAVAGLESELPTPEQESARQLAATLASEMLTADAIVVAAPLYNWGPSEHIKCWIDMLWTDPRFAPRTYPLTGKPITLVVARGGGASPGSPQEGWDHSVPFLLHTFGTVFGGDVDLVETELTLAETSPAMSHLLDKAAELREQSHARAQQLGSALAHRAA